MSGVSGFGFSGIGGFRVGFSGRVFGAPDFDIFFKQTILRHFELELGLSPFIRVVVYIQELLTVKFQLNWPYGLGDMHCLNIKKHILKKSCFFGRVFRGSGERFSHPPRPRSTLGFFGFLGFRGRVFFCVFRVGFFGDRIFLLTHR